MPPISKLHYPIDFIELSTLEKADFSQKFSQKYKKGFSVKEIAEHYGHSKSFILKELKRLKCKMRPKQTLPTLMASVYGGRMGGKPFYGFCYFEGKLTKHPAEFPTLQLIHQQWQKKVSTHYITCELNKRKIKSREGREWSWAAVSGIIKRFENGTLVIKDGSFQINPNKGV